MVGTYLKEDRRASRRFRMGLAAMRLIVVGLVLVMLAQVTLFVQPTSLPYVVVLVDDSTSMTHADRYEDKLRKTLKERVAQAGFDPLDRWSLACTLLTESKGALFSEALEAIQAAALLPERSPADHRRQRWRDPRQAEDDQAEWQDHALGAAIHTVLEDLGGSTPAAVLIFSDGINTEGPSLGDGAMEAAQGRPPLPGRPGRRKARIAT